MSAIVIACSLLVAVFAAVLVYRMRGHNPLKPKIAGLGSLRMCPFCGLITSRSKACCLECGKLLPAV